MAKSQYGANYSYWLSDASKPTDPRYYDPFPNPANDGQRVENARARARFMGVDMGAGYLNPKTGELQDPDRGFMRFIGEHPYIGAGIALAPAGAAALFGGAPAAAGTAGVIPGTGIPTVAGTGVGITAPPAVTAGTVAGTTAAGTSAIDKLRKSLTSAEGAASLASLIPLLTAAARGNGNNNSGSGDLSRIQAITEARMRRADPLHQVAVQLAFQRAPISAKQGISLQNVPLPQ